VIPAKLWQSLPAPQKLRIKSKKCWAHPAVGQIHYGERITTKIQWHCPQLIHTSFHCWLCWYRFYSIFSPKCFRPNHVIGLMVYRKTGFKTDCVASQQCRNLVLLCANISSDWSDRNAHCCFWLFFRCFGISDSSNRMHQHQHIRTHFSTVEDGRFQKVPLLGNALPCLETLKVLVYQMPSSSHGRSGLLRWLNLGQNFCHQYIISYIIYHIYIYISTNFPDFPLMVFWNYQNDQNVLGFGDIRRLHCLSHHRVRLLWLNCQLCRAQSFWKKWVCPSDWTHVLHQANCQFPFVMLGEFSASHKMCEMTNDTGGFDPIWGSVKRMVKKCWTVTPFNIGTRGQSNQHTGLLWHILMKMGAQWVGTRFNDQNTFMIIKSY
jgi:hypothetical protein